MKIFFGGPLTNLKDPTKTKAFYQKMGDVAPANSCEYFWAFQRGTDPEENPDVPPGRIYELDTENLGKSDVMIAFVGEPSIGTGLEIEHARVQNIPVYLLYQKDDHVCRMVRGSPIVKGELIYSSEEDALSQLAGLLRNLTKPL